MFNMIRKPNILKMIPSEYDFIRMDDLSVVNLKHISRTEDYKSLCGVRGRYVLQEVTPKALSGTPTGKRSENWCTECLNEYQAISEPALSSPSPLSMAK